MAHARLKRLRVQAFRSFVEPAVVEFPDSGLILFRGSNLDSNGSSGSGKSSILLALSYVFGFCRFPATALQSWLTEEPMLVEVDLETADDKITISRGSKLAVTLNGKKLPGSAKQLEETISVMLGLAPELLAALTYRGQKQPGLFLSKTDSEKKEFLTTLLGLGQFEDAIEASQVQVRNQESKVAAAKQILDGVEQELAGLPVTSPVLKDEDSFRRDLGTVEVAVIRQQEQVETLKRHLRAREGDIAQAVQGIRNTYRAQVEALKAKVEDLESQAEEQVFQPDLASLAELANDMKLAQKFLAEEETRDADRKAEQVTESNLLKLELSAKREFIGKAGQVEARLKTIANDLLALEKDLCPTCERPWGAALTNRVQLEGEQASLLQQLAEIELVRPVYERHQAKWTGLQSFRPSVHITELKGVIQDIKQKVAVENANIAGQERAFKAEINKKVAEARADLAQAIAQTEQEVSLYRSNEDLRLDGSRDELETLERDLTMVQAQKNGIISMLNRVAIDNARENERFEQQQKRRVSLVEQLEAAKENLARFQSLLNAELDFQRLIGREGFLGSIFDEVLSEISEETNSILGGFPNTSHVTLFFRSESTSQKGTIKKSIVPVVSIAGHEAPLASGCSGGMITAVELAVDMAVSAVVSRRTASAPGWIILDESFEGLGTVEKEACMGILRATPNKLVLVVDHASEFKEMFTQFVNVEYQGGKSRLV